MQSFLSAQLDYILFFYGLGFILLGVTCFASNWGQGRGHLAALLGSFALLHGICEWLDLAAMLSADAPAFALLRTGLMALSYLLLLEFARRNALCFGRKAPGPWLYPVVLLAVFAAVEVAGLPAANAEARYLLALPASLATAWQFFRYAANSTGARRRLLGLIALAFALYALAAGVVVPAAHVWPADWLNQEWFRQATGVPIQLLRGLLACSIALLLWNFQKRSLAEELSSEPYAAFVRRSLRWSLAVVATLLFGGWGLTQVLGDRYERGVEATMQTELHLLAGNFQREVRLLDATAAVLAASPSLPAIAGGPPQHSPEAQRALEAAREASGAQSVCVRDASGRVLAWAAAAGSASHAGGVPPACQAAGRDSHGGQGFSFDAGESVPDYRSSAFIRAASGALLGTVVLEKPLDLLVSDLDRVSMSFFVVDPTGVIVLSNRPRLQWRALWPRSAEGGEAGFAAAFPILDRELTKARWVSVASQRQYADRVALGGGWSVVAMMPAPLVIANRSSGILVTLLLAMLVIGIFSTRERALREQIELDKQRRMQDLTQVLQLRASTDPLTGLHNRLELDDALATEVARAARNHNPLSLVLFDVDHFKEINDKHGHPAGDAVLVQLARYVATHMRKTDLLARWGGEEFAILSPGSDACASQQAAERLRLAIDEAVFGKVGRVHCSFGVAQFRTGDSVATLVERADAALYQAKTTGRNRVVVAPLVPSEPREPSPGPATTDSTPTGPPTGLRTIPKIEKMLP